MKKTYFLLAFLIIFSALIENSYSQTAATFDNGYIGVSLHRTFGRLRFFVPSNLGVRVIDRTGVLVGTAPDKVYDYKNDYDPIDTPYVVKSPTKSDYEIYGSFGNGYSNLPPNILSKWNIYAWQNKKFVIVKFEIINNEPTPVNAYIGMESVLQTQNKYGGDTVEYIPSSKTIYIYNNETQLYGNIGIKWLSAPYYTIKNMEYFADYWLGDTLLYNMLTAGTIENSFISPNNGEPTVNFLSQAPVSLTSGASTTCYVAFAFAGTRDSILLAMAEADQKYAGLTEVNEKSIIPSSIKLFQNYPNPFNPATNISFSLNKKSKVTLKVYNLMGIMVKELLNGETEAGHHTINFNANYLPSGTYFYELATPENTYTRKMILIK